jgi:hypothetical protein
LLEAGVGVGDDQLDAMKPAGSKAAQERRPERAILRVADIQARTSRPPSAVTPVAMTTARLTTRPSMRALR